MTTKVLQAEKEELETLVGSAYINSGLTQPLDGQARDATVVHAKDVQQANSAVLVENVRKRKVLLEDLDILEIEYVMVLRTLMRQLSWE